MAILERNGSLHGLTGPVVFRRFRGRTVVQSRPVPNKKQTAASRASAGEFGLSSTTACTLRRALEPVFRNRYDGGMINRVNSAVCRSIGGSRTAERGVRDLHDGDLSQLEGLEFNSASPLGEVLSMRPVISRTPSGGIRIQTRDLDTEKDLKMPPSLRRMTRRYRLRFLATALDFRNRYYQYVGVKDLETGDGYRQLAAQDIELEGTVPEGCMVVVTLSVECLRTNRADTGTDLLNTMEYSPAAIVAVFPSAEGTPVVQPEEVQKKLWKQYRHMDRYTGNELLKRAAGLRAEAQVKAKGSGYRRGHPGGEEGTDITGPPPEEALSAGAVPAPGSPFVATGKKFSF